MDSIWEQETILPPRKALPGDVTVQAAVIGAGMAGILTAWFLQQKGVEVIVLEGSRIASGQTCKTTAKITSQHGVVLRDLVKRYGEEKAALYAAANERAIAEYRRIITENHIACDFTECPSYLYSLEDEEMLREEAELAAKFHIKSEFTHKTSLPFSVKGALRYEKQARFQPLTFIRALSDSLTIYEHTRVMEVKKNEIYTDHGTVFADHIIFASHFPFMNTPGYYFMRMHQERSYVLALRSPSEDAAKQKNLDGIYYGIDQNGLSLRPHEDYILLGGGNHRTGENSEGGKYDMLRKAAAEYFPGWEEETCWSAQDCMTADGLPYIGPFSESAPGWYVATGFGKWGMTSSMISAMILSDLITGKDNKYAPVFSVSRHTFSASAKTLMEEGLQAAKGLTREFLKPPESSFVELENGEGKIVDYKGLKVGAYRDKDGTLFLVSTRCPHLGCQLEWNPDELSWDCPCHGSRFNYKGQLLDNPAQEDITDEILSGK
ncbi:FAD-dependent oxidoreductase [Anaerolentibacter hominis]|uniref:FAD-dependent oxidoreductase n=1 Tax=Anaerolentibacter hominis TaxID=3079009 RepID=UPI0031B883D4